MSTAPRGKDDQIVVAYRSGPWFFAQVVTWHEDMGLWRAQGDYNGPDDAFIGWSALPPAP